MLKYFKFDVYSVCGVSFPDRKNIAEEINRYAQENELKIIQIVLCDDNGIFVVFEEGGENGR